MNSMPVVRSHHGLGLGLVGQDDSIDLTDFGDSSYYDGSSAIDMPASTPVSIATLAPSPLVLAPSPSSIMLPSNMQTVSYADGTSGFFDPADGTYYDSQGNDVSGYVSNFGGAKITGAASAAQIAAAEGISTPGAAPRVNAPIPTGALAQLATALVGSSTAGAKKVTPAAPPASASGLIAGMSLSSILLLGGGALLVMAMMGGRR